MADAEWRARNRANWDEPVAIHLKASDAYDQAPLGVYHTIYSKSYAKRPFRSRLPFGSVPNEDFEREIPRICCRGQRDAQTFVCKSQKARWR